MHIGSPPLYLAAFALCAVPVIIYLVFRRKRKDVAWGAMYILRRLLESKSRTTAWKQYAIVALRALALAALAFAFLHPFTQWRAPGGGAFPKAPRGTHRFILLDVSNSMDAACGSGSCFDAAMSLCRKTLAAATAPGRIDILPLDGRDEPFTFASPPIRQDNIESFIARLSRGHGPADLEKGLQWAVIALRATPYERRELYVLSDLSAADLDPPERFACLFRTLRAMGVKTHALRYANPDACNFGLHELSPQMDVLLAGQPTIFYITIGCYPGRTPSAPTDAWPGRTLAESAPHTTTAAADAKAETWLAIRDESGNTLFEDTLALAPGRKTLQVPLVLPAGDHVLTASLKDDDYLPDNVLTRSFHVAGSLRVVVLQDINLSDGLANPREWVKYALGIDAGVDAAPLIDGVRPIDVDNGSHGRSTNAATASVDATSVAARYRCTADFVNPAQIGPGIFEDRDAAIFLDVDRLPPDGIDAARRYAARGGTLLLAPGPAADAARFSETFASISPARIMPPAAGNLDPDVYENPVLEKADNLVLMELESPEHGNIGTGRFYRHYRVEPGDVAEGTDVLFSLTGGSPLCLYRPIGRGGCLLWTAGLGMDWHSMVVHPAYPVFFARMLNLAADRRRFPRNIQPGQPIIAEVDAAECAIIEPGGAKVAVHASGQAGTHVVRYDHTDAPGVYLLLTNPDDSTQGLRYVVRDDRRESDYRPLDPDGLRTLERLMGSRLCRSEQQLAAAVGQDYPGRQLMPHAAAMLLGLLLFEAGLARRWFA